MQYVKSKFFSFLFSYESKCMKDRLYEFRPFIRAIKLRGEHLNIILSRIDNDYLRYFDLLDELSLDLFCFFTVFRVLLDDLAKTTRYFYPDGISRELFKSFSHFRRRKRLTGLEACKKSQPFDKLRKLDPKLIRFLSKKIPSLWSLTKTRNKLVHELTEIIGLPQGRQIIMLENNRERWRSDLYKTVDKIIDEFRGLQEFYICHFSEKVKEYCPDFKIDSVTKMSSELEKFFV